MQDRFKFRVWKGQENRMVYDVTYLNPLILDPAIKEENKHNILMQCTGLKDKNGKLIYEGDILGGTFENLYVHYCDDCKQFQLKANDYGCLACEGDIHWYEIVDAEEQNELEVIGNIYENKELLNEI